MAASLPWGRDLGLALLLFGWKEGRVAKQAPRAKETQGGGGRVVVVGLLL